MGDKSERMKNLSRKQAELAKKQAVKKELPPWDAKAKDIVQKDLREANAYLILKKAEEALTLRKCPVSELDEIRVLTLDFLEGMNRVNNASRREPKHREKLAKLYFEIESLINRLDNKAGFDLFDESTWEISS
jgi:adenylosuccinate synthase